jgi:hypothetical protein
MARSSHRVCPRKRAALTVKGLEIVFGTDPWPARTAVKLRS